MTARAQKRYILPLFIPFAGCKRRCLYCNQTAITKIGGKEILSSVKEQLRIWKSRRLRWDEAAFYGGTFANLPQEIRFALYELASPLPVRISTCPDSVDEDFLIEAKAHISLLEIGVQSLSKKVLDLNRRDYAPEDVFTLFERFKVSGVETAAQFMVSMYGEGREEFGETCDGLTKLKSNFARIYPTLVLKNSALAGVSFSPPAFPETLLRTAMLYASLMALGIKVIRVGLPPVEKEEVLGGFYHPAMGELVKTLLLRIYLEDTRGKLEGYAGYAGALRGFLNKGGECAGEALRKAAAHIAESYPPLEFITDRNALTKANALIEIALKVKVDANAL